MRDILPLRGKRRKTGGWPVVLWAAIANFSVFELIELVLKAAWSMAVNSGESMFRVGWRVWLNGEPRVRPALWTDVPDKARSWCSVCSRFSAKQDRRRGRYRCGCRPIFCGAWSGLEYHLRSSYADIGIVEQNSNFEFPLIGYRNSTFLHWMKSPSNVLSFHMFNHSCILLCLWMIILVLSSKLNSVTSVMKLQHVQIASLPHPIADLIRKIVQTSGSKCTSNGWQRTWIKFLFGEYLRTRQSK